MASLSPLTTAPTPPRPTHSRLRSTTISSLNNAPASSSTSTGGAESSPTVRLTCWAHKDTDKLPLVILNPKAYPHARDGDIIRITQLDSPAVSGLGAEGKKKGKEVMRGGMLFKYGEKDVAAIDNPRLKVRLFGFPPSALPNSSSDAACLSQSSAAFDPGECGLDVWVQGGY